MRLLAVVGLVAGVIGWILADWTDRMGRLISIPWLAPATIWLFTFFLVIWTVGARGRLGDQRSGPRMDALVAARTTALALAGSRTGALVFGIYAGIALRLLDETGIAAGRARLIAAVFSLLGGLAMAAVALWLERICRVPRDPSSPASG